MLIFLKKKGGDCTKREKHKLYEEMLSVFKFNFFITTTTAATTSSRLQCWSFFETKKKKKLVTIMMTKE